jgi:hypothetical protein
MLGHLWDWVAGVFGRIGDVSIYRLLLAITPGGVGQTQALDVATLRGHASSEDIAAFSITQDAILTIWNVVLGVIVMLWAFGYGAAKDLLFKRNRAETRRPTARRPAFSVILEAWSKTILRDSPRGRARF